MRLGTATCKCGAKFERTGYNHVHCKPCAKKAVYTYYKSWLVKTGRVKKPGVGSGNAQGKGVKNHSYKHGTGSFRKYIKAACERCASVKFLCVHHKDRNRLNNKPKNLETLCKSCHQKEHEVWKNFTKNKEYK